MDDNVECQDCGWQGMDSELLCSEEDDKLGSKPLSDIAFNRCPDCDSTDVVDIEDDET